MIRALAQAPDGCSFFDDAIARGVDAARLAGVQVINLSLGGAAPGPDLLAAMQRAVNAGIIIVIAAGNDGTPNPDPFALKPAQQFPGMVIIAGSVGARGAGGTIDTSKISTFSDRAGTGAQWYLMAVGYHDRAPDETGAQFLWDGTSFSAPTIAGAVALLAQAFPTLTGAEIVDILFASADDLGAPGVDAIYGNGRLNIGRAFQPVGTTTLAGSQVALTSRRSMATCPKPRAMRTRRMPSEQSFSTDTAAPSSSISRRRCGRPCRRAGWLNRFATM